MTATLYRLAQLPTGRGARLYVSDFFPSGHADGGPWYVWTHDVRKASTFTRLDALRIADELDARHVAYRAASDNPAVRDAVVKPMAIVARTGGAFVDRRAAADHAARELAATLARRTDAAARHTYVALTHLNHDTIARSLASAGAVTGDATVEAGIALARKRLGHMAARRRAA